MMRGELPLRARDLMKELYKIKQVKPAGNLQLITKLHDLLDTHSKDCHKWWPEAQPSLLHFLDRNSVTKYLLDENHEEEELQWEQQLSQIQM